MHALALRRWAFACLSSGRSEAEFGDRAVLGDIVPTTWRLFLAAERCAAALARCPGGLLRDLPRFAQELLSATARAELQRILVARSQLQVLSHLARETGCRPILLRGGASLTLDDRSFDLDDLDLVLPPREVARFAAALDAAGYRPLVGSGSHRHLDVRAAPGSLDIEIHVSKDREQGLPHGAALENVRSLPGAPGLARLSALEHAWNILAHVTVDHIYRRGQIRDVLLLADAIAECSPDESAALARRAAEHPAAGVMDAQLAMARAINDAKPPIDAFETVALTNYVVRLRAKGMVHLPGNLPVTASNLVFAILGGPIERRGFWTRETSIPMEPSRFAFIAWVQRRFPALGRRWLLFFRLLRLPVALALAVPLVVAARRALGRAGLAPRIG